MILLGHLSRTTGGCLEFQGRVRSLEMAAQEALKFVLSPEKKLYIYRKKATRWKIPRPNLFGVGGQS